ncbi:MAG: pilin [Patescibacteria group bacterium]
MFEKTLKNLFSFAIFVKQATAQGLDKPIYQGGGTGKYTLPRPDVLLDSKIESASKLSIYVDWLMGIFWTLAVGMVIWAAFLYLTAGGDEEKVKEAKKRILYAVIAAVIALLATGIQAIVGNLLTGTT